MPVFNNILAGASGATGAAGYEIERSLRFNSGDSAYLSRDFSAGNRRTWTWSGWVKRSTVDGSYMSVFGAGGSNRDRIQFFNNQKLVVNFNEGADGTVEVDQVFRDPSAWYHIVAAVDTTQATASNRVKIYVNGSQVTAFDTATYPSQNYETRLNNNIATYIGQSSDNNFYFDGYLADVHFIDGQALAASDFGEYDDNNVWQPKAYSGTYGTNGFHLDFSDNSSNAALGTDSSGNSNDWTVNNLTASEFGAVFLDGDTSDLTGTQYNATYALANLFDSDKTNRIAAASDTTIVYTPSPAITADKFRFHYQLDSDLDGFALKVNDVDYTSSLSNGSNKQIDINVQTLTKVEIRTDDSNQWLSLYYIEKLFEGAGAGTDSLIDTPTNYEAASGNNGGNYATLNPLASGGVTLSNGNLDVSISTTDPRSAVSTISASSGKWYAEFTCTSGGQMMVGVVTDQYSPISGTTRAHAVSSGGGSVAYHATTGNKRVDTVNSSYGATYGNGDLIGIALNLDDDEITFYKNGSSQGTITTKSFAGGYTFFASNGGSTQTQGLSLNFGQRPFAYTPPTGYVSLCTQNLPDPTIADGSTAMDAALYTGNSGTKTISGLNFSPDLTWIKARSEIRSHFLFDTVRGATDHLKTDSNESEQTTSNSLTTFNSDGFALGASAKVNNNTITYVAWTWDAGSSNTTISAGGLNSSAYNQSVVWSNGMTVTSGSITNSSNAFNGDTGDFAVADAFSTDIVVDLGNTLDGVLEVYGSSGATHDVNGQAKLEPNASGWHKVGTCTSGTTTTYTCAGASNAYAAIRAIRVAGKILVDQGTTPAVSVPTIASTVRANPSAGFSIVSYTGNATNNATIGHGLNAVPEFAIFKDRDTTRGWAIYHKDVDPKVFDFTTSSAIQSQEQFNETTPTSSVFTLGSGGRTNQNGSDVIAYCWTSVEGYSAFGSYEGNGSNDGPFVYTGFKVAFLLRKSADSTRSWSIVDSARSTFNEVEDWLEPNTSSAEQGAGYTDVDFLSNGFKIRTNGAVTNSSSTTYIYAAFAENPFQANGGLAR